MATTELLQRERASFQNRRLNTQLILAICADWTSLEEQKLSEQTVKTLLNRGANPNTRCQESLLTVCHIAVCYGRHEILGLLLDRGADSKARDKKGIQPHHMAAFHYRHQSSVKCIDTIFNKDAALINSPIESPELDSFQEQILENELDSFVHNHQEITKLVPESVTEGSTVLFVAAKRGIQVLVEDLLKRHADVNKAAKDNLTPLDVTGLEENIKRQDSFGSSSHTGDSEADNICELLLKNAGKPTAATLYTAVVTGHVEAVKDCLKTILPYLSDATGRTLLHAAVKNNNKCLRNKKKYHDILELLLDKDLGKINERDRDGKTPIFIAVEEKWMEDVELLLQKGADITIPSRKNENLIHLAAIQGNPELLEVLLEVLPKEVIEKQINSTDDNGYTPLFRAVEAGNYDVIEILLRYPCKKKYLETSGKKIGTLIHSAINAIVSDNDLKVVKFITYYFVSKDKYNLNYFNEQNSKGLTAVEMAASLGHKNCLEFLLSFSEMSHHFLNSIKKSEKGTALHLAVKSGHYRTIEYLLDKYPILISCLDSEGRTALIIAALRRYEKCVYLLLTRGGSLADKDGNDGSTAIDIIMNYIPTPIQLFEDLFNSFAREKKHKNKREKKYLKDTHYPVLNLSTLANKDYDGLGDSYKIVVDVPEAHKSLPVSDDVQVLLDYTCLVAGRRELEVIEAVSDCRFEQLQQIFFLHPLVKSFLFLKWKRVDFIFSLLSFIYIIHVFSITGLALLFDDFHESTMAWSCRAGIWMTMMPVIFMEMIDWILNGNIYSDAEIYTKWAATFTAGFLSVSPKVDWGRYIASVTVLLAWVELLLFYATSPRWGLYILMFFEVATNILQVFTSFIFLYVGFGLCFFILLEEKNTFVNLWKSLFKFFFIMEEVENDLLEEKHSKHSEFFNIFGHIMYFGFHFLVIMVLTNMIIGMSVGDVSKIEGKSKHLAKQSSFLSLMDKFFYNQTLLSWLPKMFQNQIKNKFHPILRYQIVYPNKPASEDNPLDKELLNEIMSLVSQRKSHTEDINSLANTVKFTDKKVDELIQQVQDIYTYVKRRSRVSITYT